MQSLPHSIFFAITFSLLCFYQVAHSDQPASVSSIKSEDLLEYEYQSKTVQRLIDQSLALTRRDLAYTFGSAEPGKGGMDCSGAVCHLLKSIDLKGVPRMSHTIYLWLEKHGQLTKLNHVHSPKHPTLRLLKPGDLVFWEGTYSVKERNPPISHVMVYLGTLKSDGKGVLFGASSGRRFRGKKIHGVSVFDFKVPAATSKARLVAFGPIPGIRQKTPAAELNKTTQKETPKNSQEKPIRKFLRSFTTKSSSGASN